MRFFSVWIPLGLNVNRFWFLNFNNITSILDNYLKFWCVSGQTFSEKVYLYYKLLGDMLKLLKNILREPRTQLSILLSEPRAQLPILLGDPINLRVGFTPGSFSRRTTNKISMKIGEPRAQLAIICRQGLPWNASKLKMAVSNRRNIFEIYKPEVVSIYF